MRGVGPPRGPRVALAANVVVRPHTLTRTNGAKNATAEGRGVSEARGGIFYEQLGPCTGIVGPTPAGTSRKVA